MSKSKPRAAIDAASTTHIRRDILGGVGYGNSPEHTRFKKGQSGNPAGRPRKAAAVATLSATNATLLAESERFITIIENGQERQITGKEAVVKAHIRTAVRGNPYAQDRLLTRIEKAERERSISLDTENAIASPTFSR